MANPGYGWKDGIGVSAVACEKGYYNSGYNRRACTQCPGGLTTAGTNSNRTSECIAPAGYYYLNGRAVMCAKGTSKSWDGNGQCDKCPEGLTTPQPTSSALLLNGIATDCSRVAAGWNGTAVRCSNGTYAGERALSGNTGCTSCPTGYTTKGLGSVDANACLLRPGYGFAGTTNGLPNAATECLVGTYNAGFNREACLSCGTCRNVTVNGACTSDGKIPTKNIDGTDLTGATSTANCAVPPGFGSNRTSVVGLAMAYECPNNTYGRSNYTWGLVDTECTKCPENSHTTGTGKTAATFCLTNPGYGWYDGSTKICAYGYYNPGENQEACAHCGEGFNTTTVGGADGATVGTEGAVSAAQCVVDFGYTVDTNTTGDGGLVKFDVKPCLQGYYKDTLGNATCLQCPSGTTTVITEAATSITDCNACRPGFGTWAQTAATRADTSCTICADGTFNYGYNLAQAASSGCLACSALGDASLTESRPGSSSPDDCYPEFVGFVNSSTSLSFDFIAMNSTLLTADGASDANTCQAACGAGCAYWMYDGSLDTESAAVGCRLRNAGTDDSDALAYDTATGELKAGVTYVLYLEINEGVYVAYKGAAEDMTSTGTATGLIGATTFASLQDADTACRAQAACVGIAGNPGANTFKLFAGQLETGFQSKVRVVGAAINGFIAQPSNAPTSR